MDDRLKDLFLISTDATDERFSPDKFFEFKGDAYDMLISPFLDGLRKLPVWRYYKVDEGARDIDLIAYQVYGNLFYGWLIQYYNDTIEETFPDGTILNLFSESDLEELYKNIANGNLEQIS